MLYITLVQCVCPLKIKITQFPDGFRLNSPWQIQDVCPRRTKRTSIFTTHSTILWVEGNEDNQRKKFLSSGLSKLAAVTLSSSICSDKESMIRSCTGVQVALTCSASTSRASISSIWLKKSCNFYKEKQTSWNQRFGITLYSIATGGSTVLIWISTGKCCKWFCFREIALWELNELIHEQKLRPISQQAAPTKEKR